MSRVRSENENLKHQLEMERKEECLKTPPISTRAMKEFCFDETVCYNPRALMEGDGVWEFPHRLHHIITPLPQSSASPETHYPSLPLSHYSIAFGKITSRVQIGLPSW